MPSRSSFSGSLLPKKKAELQQIAGALSVSDQGTKEELQTRIKKHLDRHQSKLEDDPTFAGLFSRKKRQTTSNTQDEPKKPPRFVLNLQDRRVDRSEWAFDSSRFALQPPSKDDEEEEEEDSAYEEPKKSTRKSPEADVESPSVLQIRNVSVLLKKPPVISPDRRQHRSTLETQSLTEKRQESSLSPVLVAKPSQLTFGTSDALEQAHELVYDIRTFLSNSRNIWSMTAVFEFLFILYHAIPWQALEINFGSFEFHLNIPPTQIAMYHPFGICFLHWFISTLIIPTLLGSLISFSPRTHPTHQKKTVNQRHPDPNQLIPFDPLTASIVRLTTQIAYTFPVVIEDLYGPLNLEKVSLGFSADVIGFRWRVLSAGVTLAFAFAEAIVDAPQSGLLMISPPHSRIEAESERPVIMPAKSVLTTEDTLVGIRPAK